MAIIAYLRVSTDEQAESGLGLEAQLAAITKQGKPDQVFSDEGFSGKCPKRPALLAALDSLRAGDILIAAKRDRIARDTFLALWIEKEAKRKGARILSAAGEGTESDDPAAILMRTMVDAFAQYERQLIGQRTAAALKQKRAKKEKTGGLVPFGFTEEGGQLIENKQEQEALKIMKELKTRGYSLRDICQELGAREIKTKTGRAKWQPMVISQILKRSKIWETEREAA